MAGGGGGGKAPGPSAEELAIRREELDILRSQNDVFTEQVRVQNLLAPFLFGEAGLNPILDEDGNITGFEEADDELAQLGEDIERGFLERTSAALRGELPVNPALTRSLDDEEGILREQLLKDLGPGFETSSPGIESLGDFFERKESILEGARRDDLSLSEQFSLARQGSREASTSNQFAQLFGTVSAPAQLSAGNPAAGGFSQVANLFANDRAQQLQANIARGNQRSSTLGSLFGAAGTIAGSAVGGPAGGSAGGLFARQAQQFFPQ